MYQSFRTSLFVDQALCIVFHRLQAGDLCMSDGAVELHCYMLHCTVTKSSSLNILHQLRKCKEK